MWAAFIAERLGCPMSYIRGKKKDHGTGKQIEGAEVKGKKVIVFEVDRKSTRLNSSH